MQLTHPQPAAPPPFPDSHAVPSRRASFAEWHRGRTPYVVWALDVDQPVVRALVARAAGALDGLLLDGYRRQPHVTLDLCGFPAAGPGEADEFTTDWLAARCAALRAAAIRPFSLTIGGPASFASAPYLQVADAGSGIAAVRRALAVAGRHRLVGDYVPHVTLGLYADTWPAALVGQRLAGIDDDAASCRIDRVSLLAYRPDDIGGPLVSLGHFSLARQAMVWRAAWPFAGVFGGPGGGPASAG